MSVSIMSRVFWTRIPPLGYTDKTGREVTVTPSTCKIVLLAIADSGNDEGENSWQAVDTLAEKTSLYKRSVIRAARALIANGYIRIDGISRKRTNNYTINIDKLGTPPTKKARYGGVRETPSDGWGSRQGVSETPEGVRGTLGGVSETPEPSLTIHKHPREGKPAPSSIETAKAKSAYMTAATQRDAERMLLAVSRYAALPADQLGNLETVQALITRHGEDVTRAAMISARDRWVTTQGKNGRFYSPLNITGWVGWAMDDLARGSQEQPDLTEAELEIFRQRSEKLARGEFTLTDRK